MPLKGVYTPYETAQVQKAIDYIHAHHTEAISADALVEEVRLDRKLFLRIFVFMTGSTVHNYLLKVRIDRATEDLADFSLTVEQIAYRHGFCSGSHFTKNFKERTGVRPTDYRYRLIMDKQRIGETMICPDHDSISLESAIMYK